MRVTATVTFELELDVEGSHKTLDPITQHMDEAGYLRYVPLFAVSAVELGNQEHYPWIRVVRERTEVTESEQSAGVLGEEAGGCPGP